MIERSLNEKDPVPLFRQLSKEISSGASMIIQAVDQLEQAYDEINTAILNMPSAPGNDRVIDLGLMEIILQRDTNDLMKAMTELKSNLAGFTRTLIQNASAALSQLYDIDESVWEEAGRLSCEKRMIAEDLSELKKLERRLTTNWS